MTDAIETLCDMDERPRAVTMDVAILCKEHADRLKNLEHMAQQQMLAAALARSDLDEIQGKVDGMRADFTDHAASFKSFSEAQAESMRTLTDDLQRRNDARERWRKIAWLSFGTTLTAAVGLAAKLVWGWMTKGGQS